MSELPPRLLRETLIDPPAPASSACLDANSLAAWFDGTLSKNERKMAESHLSTCARCQAVLAAAARTSAPPPARRWWQTATVRWLVPIAATSAVALVLWVKLPEQRPPLDSRRRDRPSALVAAPTSIPSPAAESAPRPQTAPNLKQPADSKDERTRVARENAPGKRVSINAEDSVASRQEQTGPAALERDAIAAPSAAAPAPAPARPDASSPPADRLAESRFVPFVSGRGRGRAPLQLVSPDPDIRWRILTDGGVERSTDRGTTWQAQSTGATAAMTAGAAPAPTTCWLVGRAGIVLLSTDGRTWQRVAFPETIDLVAIHASDGANATVTAADGRTFTTTDGAKTWR